MPNGPHKGTTKTQGPSKNNGNKNKGAGKTGAVSGKKKKAPKK